MEKELYRPHAEPEFYADKLKDCPFCGYKAEMIFIGNPYGKSIKSKVKCTNKFCRAEITNSTLKKTAIYAAKYSIESWNNRINPK